MQSTARTVGVIAWKEFPSNRPLVLGWQRLGLEAELLTPREAGRRLGHGDVALVRLDVTRDLDGVEPGLGEVTALERRGVRVLNHAPALLVTHDKLETSRALERAGVPHPSTVHLEQIEELRDIERPFVLKPRFGSWGRDVMLCRSERELEDCLSILRERGWFERHGVLIQELLPLLGHDLRIIVASDQVVGAARRVAAAGEWRTNFSLGARVEPVMPSPAVSELALRAAHLIGADLLSVDLLPVPGKGYVVIEVNGAADFDADDSLPGRNVYADAAHALGLLNDVRRKHRIEALVAVPAAEEMSGERPRNDRRRET